MARFVLMLTLFCSLAGFAGDEPKTSAKPMAPANPAFEKIKSLAGVWEGKTPAGDVLINTYRVIASGSAVLIEISVPNEGPMITVIHPDGDRILATHYCSAQNQPRYVLQPSKDPNVLAFQFLDITNAKPGAGHMHEGILTIVDADHMRQEWVWSENGKDTKFGPMEFVRKK